MPKSAVAPTSCSDQVVLSALAEHHIAPVLDACADWRELSWFGAPYWRPRSEAELRRKIAATAGPQPATEYAFVFGRGGGLVGEVSVHAIDWRNRVAQVGICIWRPQDRGSGIGGQAIASIIAWAWQELDLVRLEAWVLEGNEPSLRMLKSIGFSHEATLRRRYVRGGNRLNMHVLGLLHE